MYSPFARYKWGVKNFGKSLDSSRFIRFKNEEATDLFEVYLNTDDPVPSTDEPISSAYNYDLTNSAAKLDFIPPNGETMHSWPVAYLAQRWETRTMVKRVENSERKHTMEIVLAERTADLDRPRGYLEIIP